MEKGGAHPSSIILNPITDEVIAHRRFLAYVDLLGTTYSASTIATGYGSYIAQPLLRKAVEGREDTLTEREAQAILEESLLVLFYRDARSLDKASPTNLSSLPLGLSFHSTKSQRLPKAEWPFLNLWR